jgi:hypothetical protein
METIENFLKHHQACGLGYTWAIANCKNMQEVWDKAKPEWLIWLATRKGVVDEKTLHRFGCWSVRQIWNLLKDERSRKAIEIKELWIEGKATDEELDAAREAAREAARAAAGDAAGEAAGAAAWDAAGDAAGAAAWAAAWAAARAAAWDAAGAAAWAAARDAALKDQAKWLRDNAKPNFELAEVE